MSDIKDDLSKVLDAAPDEVEGLRAALVEGRINGSTYEGECACLVGTIANVRKCHFKKLGNLKPDSNRPSERWFLMFRPTPGHKPDHHEGARITLGWIDEWLAKRKETANAVKGGA